MSKIYKPFSWLLLGLVFVSLNCGPKEDSHPPRKPLKSIRLDVPDLVLPVYGEDPSSTVTLSSLVSEKAVLMVFWATWCPSCKEDAALLNEWQAQGFPSQTKILAINVGETEEAIRRFEEKQALQYTVLLDPQSEASARYQVQELPTVILLAKGGKILYYGFRLPKNIETYLVEGERSNGLSRPGF